MLRSYELFLHAFPSSFRGSHVTHTHAGHCCSVCKGCRLTGSYVSMGAWGRHTA